MDVSAIVKSLMTSSQLGLVGILLIAMYFGGKFFWKEYNKLQSRHKEDIREQKEEYKDIVKEMFEVVNKNTESHTKLSEAVRDMSQTIGLSKLQ